MGGRYPRFNPYTMAGIARKLEFQSVLCPSSSKDLFLERKRQEYINQCAHKREQEVDQVIKLGKDWGEGIEEEKSEIGESTRGPVVKGKENRLGLSNADKRIAFCSPEQDKKIVIQETPSTDGQMEGEGFAPSFEVQPLVEGLSSFSEPCAWWYIPPLFCPWYGMYLYPTYQNFYFLEYSDDSDWAYARGRDRVILAVWNNGFLAPIPTSYGYVGESSSNMG